MVFSVLKIWKWLNCLNQLEKVQALSCWDVTWGQLKCMIWKTGLDLNGLKPTETNWSQLVSVVLQKVLMIRTFRSWDNKFTELWVGQCFFFFWQRHRGRRNYQLVWSDHNRQVIWWQDPPHYAHQGLPSSDSGSLRAEIILVIVLFLLLLEKGMHTCISCLAWAGSIFLCLRIDLGVTWWSINGMLLAMMMYLKTYCLHSKHFAGAPLNTDKGGALELRRFLACWLGCVDPFWGATSSHAKG